MNYCYIFTFFCAIFVLAFIFEDSIKGYVASRLYNKTGQQLNAFRQKAIKTNQDLERLTQTMIKTQEHGKRQRRQTTNINNIASSIDIDKLDLDAINTDFSKEQNIDEVWRPDRSNALKSSKDFNGFLSNEEQYAQLPSNLNLWESEPRNYEPNEELNESKDNKQNDAGNVLLRRNSETISELYKGRAKLPEFSMAHVGDDIPFSSNDHSYGKSKNYAQNTEILKNFLRKNSGRNSFQMSSCLNSDLSSCQNCGKHEQVKNRKNQAMKNKYSPRVSDHQVKKDSKYLPKSSKNLKKLNALKPSQQFLGQKYTPENQKNEEDDEDEGDDNLYTLKYPAIISTGNKQETENRISSLYKNDNNKSTPNNSANFKPSGNSQPYLNDQLGKTKNNLSHEANYKLSKVEQDASEKKKDFSWKWGLFKRSYQFNPMNEIKLKTSSRLMRKGFGPSLPSYSLGETHKELLIENMLRKKESEILQQKRRNMATYNEPLYSLIKKANKNLEDLEETPLKPALELNQNNFNYNRKKRKTHSLARCKRELQVNIQNVKTGLRDSKAFNGFKELAKQLNKIKAHKEPSQPYIIKPNSRAKNFIKPLISNENISVQVDGDANNEVKESKGLENTKKAQKLKRTLTDSWEQDKTHFALDTINKNCKLTNFQEALNSLQNETITLKTNLPNMRAKNKQITYYKTHVRRKRSLEIPTKDLDAPKTANISFNKLESLSNFLKTSNTRKQSSIISKTFKMLKHAKRKNPKKFLRFYKQTGQSFKKLIKFQKRSRKNRASASNSNFLNSSTEKHNFITKFTKILHKKARSLKKQLKAFVKETLKYLKFQKTYNQTLKEPHNSLNESLENESFKALPIKTLQLKAANVSEANKKVQVNESFTIGGNKKTNDIKINRKLKFLREKLHSLFSYNLSCKHLNEDEHAAYYKSRPQRSVRNMKEFAALTDKYKKNGSSMETTNSEEVKLNSNCMKNKTSISRNFLNNLLKGSKVNENVSQKSTNSDFKASKKENLGKSSISSIKAFKDKLNDTNVFGKNLYQTLSSNKSFVSRKRQKRAFASNYKGTMKTLKRSKRSLNSKQFENDLKFDTSKYSNKESGFSQFDNLYKPQHNTDFLDRKQSKLNLENEFLKPSDFDFQQNHKSFNSEQFNNFKEKVDTVQNFDDVKFDNLWFKDKSLNDNFNERKRFLKPKKTRKPQKYFKRHNLNTFQTNKAVNETKNDLKFRNFPLKVQMLKDKYLSDLKDFNQNYKFNENHFNWQTPIHKSYKDIKDNSTTNDDSQKLSLELRNEILNCKAFASLEEFLKSLPKNITNSLLNGITELPANFQSTEQIEMEVNTPPIIMEVTTNTEPTVLDSTITSSTTIEETTIEETETNTECSEDVSQQYDIDSEPSTETNSEVITGISSTDTVVDAMAEDLKLNITINANVHGNPKTHQFCGNGSFNFIPGLEDDRRRRNVFISTLENLQKRKCAQIPTQKPYDTEDTEDFGDLISGKLSSNIVKTILHTVRDSPNLKVLWPSLQQKQVIENTATQNFYAIRNQQNENELQNHEKLLAQIMASINNIIEEQARSHACVPLRPDLQEFYNMILQSRREQDMVREKRQLSKTTKNADFSYKIHSLDPNRIEEETKIVRKLLKQYDKLPPEDQQQVSEIRDDLMKNLLILSQLQYDDERHDQELRQRRQHVWTLNDEKVMNDRQSQHSVQFLKLLKAAELYRETTSE